MSRRLFLGWTAAATAAAAHPASARAGSKGAAPPRLPYAAVLPIAKPSRVRILQVTDLHFFSGKGSVRRTGNTSTWAIVAALVDETRPDLVIATGDLWPENEANKGEARMRWAIEQFESLGVPWAFTWGNHDLIPDYAVGHAAFAGARNSLYRGAETGGNYVIDVTDRDGGWLWQLVCVNTGQEGLGAGPQAWLRTLAQDTAACERIPPRIAFFHIPLKQFAEIWDSGAASGVKGETVCFEKEDGTSLALLKALGIRACFCGHDHVNDYSALADGVELVYGRATGVGGYGGDVLPRGGKLITGHCGSGRVDWVTVLPGGVEWRPTRGERLDKTPAK